MINLTENNGDRFYVKIYCLIEFVQIVLLDNQHMKLFIPY